MTRQGGFSLLEVAIAMGVLAVGLSGLCALLIKSAAGVATVSHRASAHWLAERLQSELSLTPQAVVISTEPIPSICTPDSPCQPTIFAAANLAQWHASVAQSLPSGSAHLCFDRSPEDGEPGGWACEGEGQLVVKLAWRETGVTGEWESVHRILQP